MATGRLDVDQLNRRWVGGKREGGRGREEGVMPFEEVAWGGGRGGGRDGRREERRMRHFGAGTAMGVFRPHAGREGWRERRREGGKKQQPEDANAVVVEEEEEEVEKEVVVEGVVPITTTISNSSSSSSNITSTTSSNNNNNNSSSSSSSPSAPSLSHPPPIWPPLGDWSLPSHPPLHHSLSLVSAYAHRPSAHTTGEPAFTSYHGKFKGAVDYIWYNGKEGGTEGGTQGGSRLRCVEFWGMPTVGELRSQVGLPCRACPSDHLPLVVKMEWM